MRQLIREFSGFSLEQKIQFTVPGITGVACWTRAPVPELTTATPSPTMDLDGYKVHNAYHITWGDIDPPSMSTQPSESSCGQANTCTSTTGSTAGHETSDSPSQGWVALSWFLVIGIPIIGFVFLCCCFACFYNLRRHPRPRPGLPRSSREVTLTGNAQFTQASTVSRGQHSDVHNELPLENGTHLALSSDAVHLDANTEQTELDLLEHPSPAYAPPTYPPPAYPPPSYAEA